MGRLKRGKAGKREGCKEGRLEGEKDRTAVQRLRT